MNKKIKQILVAFGVAVLALILYALFSGGFSQPSQSGDTLVSTKNAQGQSEGGGKDAELANERILKILGSVKGIELNDDIFSNPLFKQLRDARFTFPRPVKLGRPNPFAPIGLESLLNAQQDDSSENMQDTSDTTFFDTSVTNNDSL